MAGSVALEQAGNGNQSKYRKEKDVFFVSITEKTYYWDSSATNML